KSGLAFPCRPKPVIAQADYLNDGRPGLFVTSNEREGAVAEWRMVGAFTEAEDKKLEAGPNFNPKDRPEIKLDTGRWNWQAMTALPDGTLEVRRAQPSPNAVYAHATFDWPRAEKIRLHIGSEHPLTAWLNGKQVYQ